jgi:hypothetical protein
MENKKNVVMRYMAAICMLLGCFMCGTSCRNEPAEPKEKIESIAFDKERVVIKINEETTVKVTAKSDAAKKNEKIAYTSVNEGVIEIREPTNDGFIVKGLKGGSTVITAKSELVTSYFEVVVESEDIIAQYITVAQPVIEMLEGERRSTQVSLYGGSVLDNNDFVWRLENGKDNISIDITANIAVITALERGYQKIIVSHPKSDYDSEILVFVRGVDESIKYISSMSNVVVVENDGQYHDFAVLLVNGSQEDSINFEYTVVEGEENIEIAGNGNVCNVKGIYGGTSVIRVSHPLAIVDFDVRIITYDVDVPYIVLGETFVLLSIGESVNIAASVEYARNGVLSENEFAHIIIENDEEAESGNSPVEVVQNNNHFYIRGRRGGTARIVVSNAQAQMPREILVVVRNEVVYRDDYYITTSQNVIMTQIGADAVQLNMQLVNGNTADANGFEWEVDDGTIITVESAHGIVRGNRAAIASVFNAIAIITPKKAGTAKITVSHPKSEVTATVMVKVYPKGTFVEPPILVGYEGLIKVKSGADDKDPDKSPKTIQLHMVSGDIFDVGVLSWAIADTNIATANTGAHGMVNVLNAVSNGLTKMIVNGVKLEYPHESLVLAGTPEFVDMASVIYVDSMYQKMVTEQTVRIEVKDSQNKYTNSNNYKAEVEDKDLLYAVMIKNQLVLQGKGAGETKVRITNDYAMNDITLNVRIDPAHITIDKPYYINGPEITGVVRGVSYDGIIEKYQPVTVALVGAGESETGKLVWSIDDTSVASIMANGNKCIITGRISSRQTKIRVSHNKAENEKVILLYVVENESDLYNKVVLGAEKENYLMVTGEEKLITLITNASESKKSGIQWKVKCREHAAVVENCTEHVVVALDPHYDSAMARAAGAGNVELEVTHNENILPLSIYVSVVDALSAEKIIKGPAVIELIRGESRIIAVDHVNLSPQEIQNIHWKMETENSEIANVQENGDSAYFLGKKKGVDYVNIRQDGIGYKHRATLVCANTPEELATMYVMGVESSYHTMLIGEEKRIKLSFGSAGFPENEKSKIEWAADSTGVVRVVGKGESVSIVAAGEGEATVTVSSGASFNETLTIQFLVRSLGDINYEFRGHEKIVGIVVGESKRVTMRVYDGDTEITGGYSSLEHENTNNNVIDVNLVDNLIDITAKTAGQSYITVRHKNNWVREPAKILVYTANTAAELDQYYPILVEKTNYLLHIGEQAAVKIETIANKDSEPDGSGRTKFQNISWGVENASVIDNVDFSGKKEVVIKAKSEGQCIISVSYNGNVVERIFITVVSNDTVDMTKYIVTENIIGIVKGENYQTKIFGNLSANEIAAVIWESGNTNVVTVNGNGENGTLRGIGTGEAYVTVSYGSWLKRHVLVYVCDTKEQANAYKAMNMENQYYRAGPNEAITLPVYYAPVKTAVPTLWVDKYDNKVVRFNALESGGKLEITTLNEGVAVLEATNTGLNNTGRVLRIYIEVSKRYSGAPKPPEQAKFITISKTVYVMNPDEPDTVLDLSVSGVGMTAEELANVSWEIKSGNQYVSHYPNGKDCRVRVNQNGSAGTAVLEVSGATNFIEIKVIVSRTGLAGFPYIAGDATVQVGLKQKILVEYDVAEIETYNKNLFEVQKIQGGDNVNAVFTGNMLEIEGLKPGQSLLRVICGEGSGKVCEGYKEVLVIVTSTPNGIIYLTTRDNFSVVKINEYKTISVDMVGFEGAADRWYEWTVDSEHEGYIEKSETGNQCQIKGLTAGAGKTAKITVSYTDPGSVSIKTDPVVLYVRVSEADAFINTKYLSTTRNIVSLKEKQYAYLDAEIVNGTPGDQNQIRFRSLNSAYATVTGQGTQAVVTGVSPGVARIEIYTDPANLAANSGIQILVVVEKDTASDNIYITTDSTLITMKRNEQQSIRVNLVNAESVANLETGYTWAVTMKNSVEKNTDGSSKQVIELLSTGQTRNNSIRSLCEGEAVLTVKHVSTRYELQIRILVEDYSQLQFMSRSVTLTMGDTPATVLVQTPARISSPSYLTRNSAVAAVTGTRTECRITPRGVGVTVITVFDPKTGVSDDIIVEVLAANRQARYIQTPDVLYNMTDWQSSLNRLVIAGKTVGEKESGVLFGEADDINIRWLIVDSPSESVKNSDIIRFDNGIRTGNSTSYKEATGKTISIYTNNTPGLGVITVKHSDMPQYEKKVYVNVSQFDANFRFDPRYCFTQVGNENVFEATLGNITDVSVNDFNKIIWEEVPDENNINGLALLLNKTGETPPETGGSSYFVGLDGITDNSKVVGKRVVVKAEREGPFTLRATYDGANAQDATVFAEYRKTFEIMGETVITLLPNKTKFIGLRVEPAGSKVEDYKDYGEYLDINYIGPIDFSRMIDRVEYNGLREKVILPPEYDPTIMPDGINQVMAITGKERDGYTQITLTSNNIERMITVNTNHNYTFHMKGIVNTDGTLTQTKVVRGKPGDIVTVEYEVFPEFDEVTWLADENNGYDQDMKINNIEKKVAELFNPDSSIDKNAQRITIKLVQAGYTTLKFESRYNKPSGLNLEIPVYVYYDRVNLTWRAGNRAGLKNNANSPVLFSHGDFPAANNAGYDIISNAVYVADNEKIEITYIKDVVGNPMGIGDTSSPYPNAGVLIENAEMTFAEGFSGDIKSFLDTDNSFRIEYKAGENSIRSSAIAASSLLEVEYAGYVTVTYKYYTGGNSMSKFNRKIMVYREKWARKTN